MNYIECACCMIYRVSGGINRKHRKWWSEGGEAGSSSYATLVALVANHLYIAIDTPVGSPAGEKL